MTAVRWVAVLFSFLLISPALAIEGDVNHDGRVDFADFILLADNFGLE